MALTPRTVVLYNVSAAIFFLLLITLTLVIHRVNTQSLTYVPQRTGADAASTIDSMKDIDDLRRYAKLQVELRDTHSQVVDALLVRIREITLWLCGIAAGLFTLGAWLSHASTHPPGIDTGGVRSNTTPHTDARDVPAPASDSAARAGGRERYSA
ncbi:MAG: hypothetical protein ACREVD_16125 [Burkholderiales bacterium]